MRFALSLIAVATLASAQRARADETLDIDTAAIERFLTEERLDIVARVARGTVKRARRAVSFGPEVGASVGYLTAGDVDLPLTAGLGLVLFKVPVVPSTALIKDVIRAKLKLRLREHLKAVAAGASPKPEAEVQQLILDIYQGVYEEIVAEVSVRARRLERPRFALHVEGGLWPRLADGEARIALLLGAGRIAVGPTLALHIGDDIGLSAGGEIDFHVTLSKGPRAHPLMLFVRGEYNVDDHDVLLLGARVMLDLI